MSPPGPVPPQGIHMERPRTGSCAPAAGGAGLAVDMHVGQGGSAMKSIRMTAVGLLLAVVASTAYGETVRLSWNSCDPWNRNTNFADPGGYDYYKLVISATGCDGPYVGHESVIETSPSYVPDAWRFDDNGCQTGSQLSISTNALSKVCPAFRGGGAVAVTSYTVDGNARIHLGISFAPFTPSPTTLYTLWQLTFDHTYSVSGPSNPGEGCGGAEQQLGFSVMTTFHHTDGTSTEGTGPERFVTWNGCSDSTTTHIITATADSGGVIVPAGAVPVCEGASQTFTITPHTGYQIADVLADGESVGAVTSYTFPDVREDHTVAARFAGHRELVRLSWNSCDSWASDQVFRTPGIYKLVLSATECDGQYVGHSSVIDIAPGPIPDAWRFDDGGCQTSSQWFPSTGAFSKTCPALRETSGFTESSYYGIDQSSGHGRLVLSCQHAGYTATSAERYTLWTITLDHAYSVVGPTTPGVDCGGVELPLAFGLETDFWHADGVTTRAIGEERHATWNGGVVRTVPTTWGQVKALYR
jgi:hypothetical protein